MKIITATRRKSGKFWVTFSLLAMSFLYCFCQWYRYGVSLLTLNRFQKLFWCFHYWFWTRQCWQGNLLSSTFSGKSMIKVNIRRRWRGFCPQGLVWGLWREQVAVLLKISIPSMSKKFTGDSFLILAINYLKASFIEYLYFFVLVTNTQFQLCFCVFSL